MTVRDQVKELEQRLPMIVFRDEGPAAQFAQHQAVSRHGVQVLSHCSLAHS